jgi:hypothetical protein
LDAEFGDPWQRASVEPGDAAPHPAAVQQPITIQ